MSDTGLPTDGPVDTGSNGPEGIPTGTPSVTPEPSSDNPAWKPLLDALPTSLHSLARPHLQEWDRNVQNLVQKVQSPYQPYKSLIDEGVSVEEIMQARNLMKMIATDPRTFYDRMTEHYSQEWGLGQNSDQGQSGDEWEEDPNEQDNPFAAQLREANAQIASMQSNQETIANYLAGQHNTQIQHEANTRVETEFNEVKTKYGELSPQQTSVIAAIAIQNEISVPEAAEILFGMQPQAAPAKPAVRVMPTTGGVPAAPPVNSAGLSGQDRRTLIANILAQNAQNNAT